MDCVTCEQHLIDFVDEDGLVNASLHKEMRIHIEGCDQCAASLAKLEQGMIWAKQMPLDSPSPEVRSAVLAAAAQRVNGKEKTQDEDRTGWFQLPQLAMAAAAMLAVGVAFWDEPGLRQETVATTAVPEPPTDVADEVRVAEEVEVEATGLLGAMRAEAVPVPDKETYARRGKAAPSFSKTKVVSEKPRASARRNKGEDPLAGLAETVGNFGSGMSDDSINAPAPASRSVAAENADIDNDNKLKKEDKSDYKTNGFVLGVEAQSKRAWSAAIVFYKRFIKKHPSEKNVGMAKLRIGQCLVGLGNKKVASQWFEQALEYNETKNEAIEELKKLSR